MITGDQIREARKLLGWSQEKAARIAGLSETLVQRAESSRMSPRNAEGQLEAIKKAFETAGIDLSGGRVTIAFRTNEGRATAAKARG